MTARARQPLVMIETTDVDVAAIQVAAIYGPSAKFDHNGDRSAFRMRLRVAAIGEMKLGRSEISNGSVERAMNGFVQIMIPLEGALDLETGSRKSVFRPCEYAAVGRPSETITVRIARWRGISLYAPFAALMGRAELLTRETLPRGPSWGMVDKIDLNAPAGHALARAAKSAFNEIAHFDSIGMSAVAAAGYEDLLMNLAVAALFPEVSSGPAKRARDSGPAIIRRARDHLEAHAAEPIELAELARDLGISMRMLQANFQRYFGLSPRDFLTECRLTNARHRLLTAGADVSVTDAAMSAGYSDISNFSAKYRDRFGELPSQTLRSSRK